MTPKWMGILALAPLILLLLMVTQQDIRGYRIPNRLVFAGIVLGLGLNALLPGGFGFNSVIPGGIGWLAALQGWALGMAVLLPLYWLRAMGAGDVKLMGMVGAFLGPGDVLIVVLATFVVGGVMALVVALWSKQLANLLHNIKLMLFGGLLKMSAGRLPIMDDIPVSVGRLPYAVAITLGTLSYLVWQRM